MVPDGRVTARGGARDREEEEPWEWPVSRRRGYAWGEWPERRRTF